MTSNFDFHSVSLLLAKATQECEREDKKSLTSTVRSISILLGVPVDAQEGTDMLSKMCESLEKLNFLRDKLKDPQKTPEKPSQKPLEKNPQKPLEKPPEEASAKSTAPVGKQVEVLSYPIVLKGRKAQKLHVETHKKSLSCLISLKPKKPAKKGSKMTSDGIQEQKSLLSTVVKEFKHNPLTTGVQFLKDHISMIKMINIEDLKLFVKSVGEIPKGVGLFEFDSDYQIRSGMNPIGLDKLNLVADLSWHPDFDNILKMLSNNSKDLASAEAKAKAKAKAEAKAKASAEAEAKVNTNTRSRKSRKGKVVGRDGWFVFVRPSAGNEEAVAEGDSDIQQAPEDQKPSYNDVPMASSSSDEEGADEEANEETEGADEEANEGADEESDEVGEGL